jgi:hypothetical protein
MKPAKPLIAQQVIALRWKDRFKILITGRLIVFLGREAGAPAGVKIYGASV